MSLVDVAIHAFEGVTLPDAVTRLAIDVLVGGTSRKLARASAPSDAAFARDMDHFPIAQHADAANKQHYEVPSAFFERVLGPRLKYSCCLYEEADTLAIAEERALAETVTHAGLEDGQTILELGCGWGSLTLWMAEHLPRATIVAVSNSASQRASIEAKARARGLTNVRIVTADMNVFETDERFDRVVSVEMFEHMANWRALLTRVRGWLKPDGALFLHVFSHKAAPYRFDVNDKSDWIAQHFFTGGIMPSHALVREFGDLFRLEEQWRWSGTHYKRTADDWLLNFDRHRAAIAPILEATYGADARLWERRWRLFFLATAGLFGAKGGTEWGVSHYRMRPA